MTLLTRKVNEATILDLGERITLGEDSGRLGDAVREILLKGSNKIIVTHGEVTYIDSSGLGEVVSAFTAVKRAAGGGELKLLNVTRKINDLLVITKLVAVFDVIDSEMAAVSVF